MVEEAGGSKSPKVVKSGEKIRLVAASSTARRREESDNKSMGSKARRMIKNFAGSGKKEKEGGKKENDGPKRRTVRRTSSKDDDLNELAKKIGAGKAGKIRVKKIVNEPSGDPSKRRLVKVKVKHVPAGGDGDSAADKPLRTLHVPIWGKGGAAAGPNSNKKDAQQGNLVRTDSKGNKSLFSFGGGSRGNGSRGNGSKSRDSALGSSKGTFADDDLPNSVLQRSEASTSRISGGVNSSGGRKGGASQPQRNNRRTTGGTPGAQARTLGEKLRAMRDTKEVPKFLTSTFFDDYQQPDSDDEQDKGPPMEIFTHTQTTKKSKGAGTTNQSNDGGLQWRRMMLQEMWLKMGEEKNGGGSNGMDLSVQTPSTEMSDDDEEDVPDTVSDVTFDELAFHTPMVATTLSSGTKSRKEIDYWTTVSTQRLENFGVDHPSTIEAYIDKGLAEAKAGGYAQATESFSSAVCFLEESENPSDLGVARVLHNMAQVYILKGRFGLAQESIDKAYEIRYQLLGRLHCDTIASFEIMGYLQLKLENIDEAQRILMECVKLKRAVFGSHDLQVAQTARFFAFVSALKNDTKRATETYLQVKTVYQELQEKSLLLDVEDEMERLNIKDDSSPP